MSLVARQQLPDDLTPFPGPVTRERCDLNNPRQSYLWALVQVPHMLFPVIYLQLISERLHTLFGPPCTQKKPKRKPKGGKTFATFPPTRDNCNAGNPYEAYLWGLVALPFQRGAPLLFGMDELQDISKKLWDLCGPPNPDWEPAATYRPPAPSEPDHLTSAGVWQ